MRLFLFLAVSSLLGGCSAFKGTFENRIACTLDGGEALFVSKYGWLGISAEVSAKDTPSICSQKVLILRPTGEKT